MKKSKDGDIDKPPRKKVHTMVLEGLIDNFRDIQKKKVAEKKEKEKKNAMKEDQLDIGA